MKKLKLLGVSVAIAAIMTTGTTNAHMTGFSKSASDRLPVEQQVITVENQAKTNAIKSRIESGAAECAGSDDKAGCLGKAFRDAARVTQAQRYGGPARSILSSGGRKLQRLPNNNDADTLAAARNIVDNMEAELRAAAPTRPNDWGKYYLQVASSVAKTKRILR